MKSVCRALLCAGLAAASMCAPAAAEVAVESIHDPFLNIEAGNVRVPSGWKFQGIMVDGSPCVATPFPVYRAYSRDGLSELRLLPRFDWTYDAGNLLHAGNGCLPLRRTLSATEFLQYYARMIGARYAGTMTVSPAVRERRMAGVAAMNRYGAGPGGHVTGDIAAVRVVSRNGTFEIEQRLRAWVQCHTIRDVQGLPLTGCTAQVDVLRAPKGKLDALASEVDANDLNTFKGTPEFAERGHEIIDARVNALVAIGHQENAIAIARQRQSFEQGMALQQHQHEQFMAQMQASTNSSIGAAISARNARSTAASDWTDYALDQQTVTGSGGTVKISNAYSQTWSNGQGDWYQTQYADENPNGYLYGNWTRQTVVHGNGTPK
ncbi:MAG: hypothetical protein IAI48_03605 [Candidatus Eremiobacteraeota bacterium]|nr:hypothetical protein [Candidatus Eremiobacteraeota bacterium]